MCGCLLSAPDWEQNWRTFGSQASTQSTETHQPGQEVVLTYVSLMTNVHLFMFIRHLHRFFGTVNF